MAVKTASNYYSNAIVGTPQVGADISVHETNTTPKFAVGFGFERADGARFRYAQFGSGTNAGVVMASQLSQGSVAVTGTNVVIQSDSATAIAGERVLPGKIGSHYLQLKLNGGFNVYAGGYLHVCAGRGQGYTYRIRGNTALGDPSATNLRLTLYEPIVIEIGTESNIGISSNPWVSLIPATAASDLGACGISMASVANNAYAWVQTSGIATVATGNTQLPLIGDMVGVDTASGGAISAIEWVATMNTATSAATAAVVGKPYIGSVILTGSNGTYSAIALNLF